MAVLPLSFTGDPAAVRVLRLARELITQAGSLQASATSLHRMQSVVAAWTGFELLIRCVWERLDGKKANPEMLEMENKIFERLGALQEPLCRPPELKGFRNLRNSIAHSGSEPSQSEAARCVDVARTFSRRIVRAVWAEDLDLIGLVDVVADSRFREQLKTADMLLRDKTHVPILEDGSELKWQLSEGQRLLIAVGLAHRVWKHSSLAVSFKWDDMSSYPFDDPSVHNDVPPAVLSLIQTVYGQTTSARGSLRRDLLAMALGIPLPAFRRFENTRHAPIGKWSGAPVITFGTSPPSPEDARYAVDFATDWVLRSEQHFDHRFLQPPADKPEP